MGIQKSTVSTTINMKAFVAVSALLAAAAADQTHHQVIKHGNAPAVSHSVHKPHGSYAAVVSSQPHAAPQDVHNPYAGEKYSTAVHAPAHVPVPVRKALPFHPAPIVAHPAPVIAHPAPLIAHPAPVIAHRPAVALPPVVPRVAPVHPAPIRPIHPAPIRPIHPVAPVHGHPVGPDAPPVYAYEYGVADEYSGANFGKNEARDGYTSNGEYRVALPDGRTQVVTYNVADAYSGYVADVKYTGEPHFGPAPVKAPHPAVVG